MDGTGIEWVWTNYPEKEIPEHQWPSNEWAVGENGMINGLIWTCGPMDKTDKRPYAFVCRREQKSGLLPADKARGVSS